MWYDELDVCFVNHLVDHHFLSSFRSCCRYPLAEQWLGNQIDEPSMEQVLQQFYHNMLKRATRGDAHIEFVSPAAASVEVKQKWEQIESGQLTLVQLNQELARRFGGNDLNSVFEPILEPMNRAGISWRSGSNFIWF